MQIPFIVVTHDIQDVTVLGDRVININEGRIKGVIKNLMRKKRGVRKISHLR
jgi:ABC-type nitrate/sulfonate/bicarbonate transport system ATPase subunit